MNKDDKKDEIDAIQKILEAFTKKGLSLIENCPTLEELKKHEVFWCGKKGFYNEFFKLLYKKVPD